MNATDRLRSLDRPLVAILRGLKPDDAVAIGRAIFEAGIEAIEVPLNSPDPFTSIERLVDALPSALVGAGTVLDPAEVHRLADLGAKLVVTPNTDPAVISAAAGRGLLTIPGCFTATEAFTALKAGASGLKIFPASALGPDGIAAMRAVLPPASFVAAVGGVGPENFESYMKKGVFAFGLGSSLFQPHWSADEIAEKARQTVVAYDEAKAKVEAS